MGNSNTSTGAAIGSREDYEKDKTGQASLWHDELKASQGMLEKFTKSGDKIVKRFKAEHGGTNDTAEKNMSRLNLFHANVITTQATMFGQIPKIDVSRRFADAEDDEARVASEMMERVLNVDLVNNSESYDAVMRSALQDRLLSGLGVGRVRYDVQTTEVDGVEVMVQEQALTDYVYWGDVLWSWSRNWADLRWVAFKNYLTKEEVKSRFGDDAAENLPYKNQKVSASDDTADEDTKQSGAWLKAEVWEIWDKQEKEVVMVCMGYDKVLKTTPDPLKLKNFFPCPPFLMANSTTQLYVPIADYTYHQDMYNEIDKLQQRISIITEAVRVVGVYNSSATNLNQMFSQGKDNTLIPVENWALFGENGGIAGQIEWVPIQDVVNTLDKLRELRAENIALLQQITGMSDVSRGSLDNQYEGVGQTQMKARMGSVRMTDMQQQFANFASGLMQLKAEVISTHFSPQTIEQMSNMSKSMDADMLPQAVKLIKSPEAMNLRVIIRPESIAMEDLAALKSERTEFITALATFMQSAAPLMAEDPAAKPFLLKMLQWTLAGFKGSYEIEGVMDKAIAASMEAAKNPEQKPDPEQVKAQLAQQLAQMKNEGEMQKIQAKTQADMQLREQDLAADIQTTQAEHQAKMLEINANLQAKLTEIKAKLEADSLEEQLQSAANVQQAQHSAEAEVQKAAAINELDVQAEAMKTSMKIEEMGAQAAIKIEEMKQAPAKPEGGAKTENAKKEGD